jgi:hypothetical protein
VGAWILAHNINMYGYNWTAIGAYGAGTSSQKNTARTVYANKVLRAIDRQAKRKNKYGAKESSSPVITSSNVASNRMRGKSAKPAHQEQPLNLSNKGTSTGHSVVVSGGESSGNGNDARQASQIRWSIYD